MLRLMSIAVQPSVAVLQLLLVLESAQLARAVHIEWTDRQRLEHVPDFEIPLHNLGKNCREGEKTNLE